MDRKRKATETLFRLNESGDFVPPCHADCNGQIRYEHEELTIAGQCPLMNVEPPCLIPVIARRERDQLMIGRGWPRKYVLESNWETCRAADLIGKWVQNRVRGEGLLIHGPVGTGKSMAAALASKALWDQGIRSRFVNAAELITNLENKEVTRASIVDQMVAPELLVLDDWGVLEPAPWTVGTIDLIVEKRTAGGRPMLVTTNLTTATLRSVPEWARFVDRWADTMLSVAIPGKSQRGGKR